MKLTIINHQGTPVELPADILAIRITPSSFEYNYMAEIPVQGYRGTLK